MTLTQVLDLGTPGESILEYINEINYAIQNEGTIDGHTFEEGNDDVYSKLEYIQDTLGMITKELPNLKEK